jgi:hypothetical protein
MTWSELRRWRRAVPALCGALAVASCTRSVEPSGGTGESHFLASCPAQGCGPELSCIASVCSAPCERASECESFAEDATCEAPAGGSGDDERLCDVRCTRDADCSGLGGDSACSDGRCRPPATTVRDAGQPEDGGEPEPRCQPGCFPVYGYPEDPTRGCVDRAGLAFLGCDCSMVPEGGVICRRRTTDDTIWALTNGHPAGTSFVPCTDEEQERIGHACEFAECELPPLSICSVEATCAQRGCEGLEYDERGCRKSPCESDDDCAEDDRCVAIECTDTTFCWAYNAPTNETCGCSGPQPCLRGAACNPVATYGPRGAWRSLELSDVNPACLTVCSGICGACYHSRRVDPSGALTIKPMGAAEPRTVMLSQEDQATLALMIEGPSLRAGLRDGLGCEQPDAATPIVLTLELPDESLNEDVTGCVADAQENEIRRLAEMLDAY